MNITCPSFLHHPHTTPPALGFTSASLIRSALFLVLSECQALCCKAYCCPELSSEISGCFFRHAAHLWRASPIWATLHCHGGSQPSPTPPLLLLVHIISDDWEMGVKSRHSCFVVYNKFLQVVSCADNARRTSQKITGNRTLLLNETGKDTPLLIFTQDCRECFDMCPCQVALTWARTKRCILSLTDVPLTLWWCLCRVLSSQCLVCISQSFSCLHLCVCEFVDNSSISVLISWDFFAWPYYTFFNIPRTNSISWGKMCERQKI